MSDTVNFELNLKHLTRVEGHGNLRINVKDGVLERATLDIVESPRFFEAMLHGRRWDELAQITCRICGICSVGHTTASLRATEAALDITPSEQTVLLRKLMLHAEFIQSHVLHAYFLAAPDYFGVGSVLPLVESHKDVVLRALRMKNRPTMPARLAGRHVRSRDGGERVRPIPTPADLRRSARIMVTLEDARETVKPSRRSRRPPSRGRPNTSRSRRMTSTRSMTETSIPRQASASPALATAR
jgi:hypothetical protein